MSEISDERLREIAEFPAAECSLVGGPDPRQGPSCYHADDRRLPCRHSLARALLAARAERDEAVAKGERMADLYGVEWTDEHEERHVDLLRRAESAEAEAKSWRRVAERLEGEKVALRERLAAVEGAMRQKKCRCCAYGVCEDCAWLDSLLTPAPPAHDASTCGGPETCRHCAVADEGPATPDVAPATPRVAECDLCYVSARCGEDCGPLWVRGGGEVIPHHHHEDWIVRCPALRVSGDLSDPPENCRRPAAAPETCWLAETTDQSHRYAQPPKPGRPVGLTSNPHEARRFATRAACLEFCCGTYARASLPPLRPVEHGFCDMPDREDAALDALMVLAVRGTDEDAVRVREMVGAAPPPETCPECVVCVCEVCEDETCCEPGTSGRCHGCGAHECRACYERRKEARDAEA